MPNAIDQSVVGLDGCKGGWVAVAFVGKSAVQVEVLSDAVAVVRRFPGAILAVDIPIGLSDGLPRAADRLARQALGRRAVCVFPSPIRGVLHASSRERASVAQARVNGRRIGVQTWAIVGKIREWDAVLRANPALGARVFEVHPEVSFAEMDGGSPVQVRKSRSAGRQARQQILARHFGAARVAAAEAELDRSVAGMDDLYDALAAAWTARRIRSGQAKSLPSPPVIDSVGIRQAIWI
jgi:predicted RNase H-like nuclease